MRKITALALGGASLVALVQPAQAALLTGTFSVMAYEGVTNGAGISAASGNPFTGANTASAAFTYLGPIDFANNAPQAGVGGDVNSAFFNTGAITGYSGSGTVTYMGTQVANFADLAGFLGSSGSASGQPYASYYTFDLGTLAAGTVLTILHDDGAAVFQNGMQVGTTAAGPTGAVTDTVTLTRTANTMLRYTRQNGTPSVLRVDIAAVPEPATWAMMLVGFGMVGAAVRYRRKGVKVTYA